MRKALRAGGGVRSLLSLGLMTGVPPEQKLQVPSTPKGENYNSQLALGGVWTTIPISPLGQ